MAKVWGISSAERAIQQKKSYSQIVARDIDVKLYQKNNPPKPGVKSTIIAVYAEKGKLAAWQALQEYNKKLPSATFTLEMLEKWIGEYEKTKNQGVDKDDGCDR